MFRGSVKGTGYSLHSPVSRSLPDPCVTVRHRISTGVYLGGCAVGISPQKLYGSRKGLVRTLKVGNEAVGMVAGGARYSR